MWINDIINKVDSGIVIENVADYLILADYCEEKSTSMVWNNKEYDIATELRKMVEILDMLKGFLSKDIKKGGALEYRFMEIDFHYHFNKSCLLNTLMNTIKGICRQTIGRYYEYIYTQKQMHNCMRLLVDTFYKNDLVINLEQLTETNGMHLLYVGNRRENRCIDLLIHDLFIMEGEQREMEQILREDIFVRGVPLYTRVIVDKLILNIKYMGGKFLLDEDITPVNYIRNYPIYYDLLGKYGTKR